MDQIDTLQFDVLEFRDEFMYFICFNRFIKFAYIKLLNFKSCIRWIDHSVGFYI